MCQLKHDLILKNINDFDDIHYPVILLKGAVDVCCQQQSLVIKINSVEQSKQYSVCQTTKEFKCLLRLFKKGVNDIHLNYCNTVKILKLNFKENECKNVIVPLYIICKKHDGRFQSDDEQDNDFETACRRITLGLELIQTLIAEKLQEDSLGRKTFRLSSNCTPFYSELCIDEARKMTQEKLWEVFAKEILKSFHGDSDREKYVAFIGCTKFCGISDTDFSYENIKSRTQANAALGGGGLALFGTGCLYTWPNKLDDVISCFENKKLVNIEKLLDDSNYRRTYGGCFATTIGSVCHEIGHIFDLGHTRNGIMGDSFDSIEKVFTNNENIIKLPKRIVKQNAKTATTNNQCTTIKKQGQALLNYLNAKEKEGIYFSRNCSIILAHHKWLNKFASSENQTNNLIFNYDTREIISSLPMAIVEVRDNLLEMVKLYWEFLDKNLLTFKIPLNVTLQNIVLFAIDKSGNILKINI